MTPLWLTLARIGEESPHATESSFTAGQRAKWERVADYVNTMPRTWFTPAPPPFDAKGVTWTDKLSASGTAEMPPSPADVLASIPETSIGRDDLRRKAADLDAKYTAEMRSTTVNHAESVADTIDDGIIRVGDVVYNCQRCGRSPKIDQKDPMRCRACGNRADTIDEQGEADEASRTPIGSQPIGSRHATDAVIGEAARGKDNEPATGARTGDRVDSLASASPSLPPWPSAHVNFGQRTMRRWYLDSEVEPWREAALARIKDLEHEAYMSRCRGDVLAEEVTIKRTLQDSLTKQYARIAALERDHESRCDQVDKLQQRLDEIRVAVGGYFADDLVQHVRVRMTELGRLTRENDELRQRERDSNALIREHDARMKVALGYSPTDGDRYSDHVRKLRDDRDDKKKRIASLEAENARLQSAIRKLSMKGDAVLASLKWHAQVEEAHPKSLIGEYETARNAALDALKIRSPAGETNTSAVPVWEAGGGTGSEPGAATVGRAADVPTPPASVVDAHALTWRQVHDAWEECWDGANRDTFEKIAVFLSKRVNTSEGAAIREDAGASRRGPPSDASQPASNSSNFERKVVGDVPVEGAGITASATSAPSISPQPAARWSEEHLLAARDVVALVWHGSTSLDPYDDDAPELDHEMKKHGDRYCAEIAKHAHLFCGHAAREISAEDFTRAVSAGCEVYWLPAGGTIDVIVRAALSSIGITVKEPQ